AHAPEVRARRIAVAREQPYREPGVGRGAELDRRGEGGFEHERPRLGARREPGRDRAAERLPVDDDRLRREPAVAGQVAPGGERVAVGALLVGPARALSVSPVVDEQRVEAEALERREPFQPTGDIAAVAV